MHSGRVNPLLKMSVFLCSSTLAALMLLSSCKSSGLKNTVPGFKLPEQGQTYAQGEEVKILLDIPDAGQQGSVDYLVDGKHAGTQDSRHPFLLKTNSLSLGYRLISAVLDRGNKKDTVTINIVLKSPVRPAMFSYKVLHVFPHDTSAYTQGLEYHDGRLLESTGEYGSSTLRWVSPESGKVLQRIDVGRQYFAEGCSLVGSQIMMLTWKENTGFIYNAGTLKQTGSFPYQNSREGWGLTYDGTSLLKSDGTNRIWFLNAQSGKEERYLDVYDDKGEVDQLNELEYIEGKIFANIYQTDNIAVIDPKSGAVERYINLSGILPAKDRYPNTDVLNGIAWDGAHKRLFVTGKKFSKLFQIELLPAGTKH